MQLYFSFIISFMQNKLTLASDSMVKEMKELKNDIKTLQVMLN